MNNIRNMTRKSEIKNNTTDSILWYYQISRFQSRQKKNLVEIEIFFLYSAMKALQPNHFQQPRTVQIFFFRQQSPNSFSFLMFSKLSPCMTPSFRMSTFLFFFLFLFHINTPANNRANLKNSEANHCDLPWKLIGSLICQ